MFVLAVGRGAARGVLPCQIRRSHQSCHPRRRMRHLVHVLVRKVGGVVGTEHDRDAGAVSGGRGSPWKRALRRSGFARSKGFCALRSITSRFPVSIDPLGTGHAHSVLSVPPQAFLRDFNEAGAEASLGHLAGPSSLGSSDQIPGDGMVNHRNRRVARCAAKIRPPTFICLAWRNIYLKLASQCSPGRLSP